MRWLKDFSAVGALKALAREFPEFSSKDVAGIAVHGAYSSIATKGHGEGALKLSDDEAAARSKSVLRWFLQGAPARMRRAGYPNDLAEAWKVYLRWHSISFLPYLDRFAAISKRALAGFGGGR